MHSGVALYLRVVLSCAHEVVTFPHDQAEYEPAGCQETIAKGERAREGWGGKAGITFSREGHCKLPLHGTRYLVPVLLVFVPE